MERSRLFAALEVQSGKVVACCAPHHTSEAFVEFLDQAVAGHRRKTIHVILDNLAVHKTPAVKAWAAAHPHVQFHFTPTYASRLNQVEIWLGMITRDCIRRGIFYSVPDLIHQIMNYIRLYNRNAQPFHWTYANPKKRTHVSLSSVTRHQERVSRVVSVAEPDPPTSYVRLRTRQLAIMSCSACLRCVKPAMM
jgi:transposase